MKKKKFLSIFPYNGNQYLRDVVFDVHKNKGVEALVFVWLKNFLQKKNIYPHTYDVATKSPPYKYVYFDLPYPWNVKAWWIIFSHIGKNILICNESSLIIPFNYWRILHIFFSKVYTWYDGLIDGKKYIRMRLPKSSFGIHSKPKQFKDKKFLVIINKNTLPFAPFALLQSFGKELYTERIKAVEFFEKNIPDRFYFYGRGWNKPKKHNISEHLFGYKTYTSYRGEVDDKIKLLTEFKYCLCFENLTDVKGYVTEKIFDCLKAKCVPIYWGATDIEKYIPKNCFIDYRNFKSYEKLLEYLETIDQKAYNAYTKNIESLLADKIFKEQWFEKGFAKFFYKSILQD